ncbi:MAG: UDP-N-acetylmuramoyl-tripeptide--D-alanyl-D-alanine ligase [Selenomonadaceae bacterium]|nr:UDP-N-acetylmuramoyl-tripeptide--D-alanyl-D-alanine ligase [Selenomonadaceae bacterium]MBR1859362.1 UDP-N-acetylmuramoyl-tripeptide--D-alanyl-D-alanine ligase [Selenomonadaceae bacterium]
MPEFKFIEIVNATEAEIIRAEDKNITFTEIVTDSRKIVNGSLFIAFKGESFNGEDFAIDAINKGAAGVIVSNDCPNEKVPNNGIVLKVDNTLNAYQKIANAWRMKFDIPVVSITGSNGKTTTKDLTAAVLSSLGKVQKTSGNFNNEIGVPLTLLGIDNNHKSAVVEIGMRGLHQIESLAKIVKPTIGIVTNVGETHIELLGSIENIARAKRELVEAIESGGTVILNADDPNVINMKSYVKPNVRIITFGIKNDADIKAVNIITNPPSTIFTVKIDDKDYDFDIPILGIHNVSNALAAIAAGIAVGLNGEQIRSGFMTLATTKMRFEIVDRNDVQIINDAYNASPASMKAALQTTTEIANGRKIAVLGDMLELGNISERVHREVGEEVVKNKFDILITLGKLGRFIAEGAKSAGLEKIFVADTYEEAANHLHKILLKGDTVLFKGSRGMKMEKIIELI